MEIIGELPDKELVKRIRSGNRDAYSELVRRYHANMLGLCGAILRDRFAAEDAAQEAFIKAYRFLDQFKGDSAFSTWLYRIASNHCLDILRRKSREKTESLDAIMDSRGRGAVGDVSDGVQGLLPLSSDAALSAENADLVERVLGGLSLDYRLILTLREVQGLNYKEIAETLDCSVDAVKARLKRARQSLREMLRHVLELNNV